MKGQPMTQVEKNKEKFKIAKEQQLTKKESQLNKMSPEEVLSELKAKGLPSFGTNAEKLDRLKKYYGIEKPSSAAVNPMADLPEKEAPVKPKDLPKANVVYEIEKLNQKREERRQKLEEMKREKAEKQAEVQASGKNIDVEFELMIKKNRFTTDMIQPHTPASQLKLCVCVRKRPVFKKEEVAGEIDAVSCANPQIVVHDCKLKVDGITKYVENYNFSFDNTFNEKESNEDVYKFSVRPLGDHLFSQGVVTCFAYGQTGSGKTHTMKGVQDLVVTDLFDLASTKYRDLKTVLSVSFFEIYGGRSYDLLNNKNKLNILEDKNNNVQIQGLVEKVAINAQNMISIIEFGNSVRTTHATVHNNTSSRSHAVCQILLRTESNQFIGKLILVDLAGSERAQDTQSNNRQRRIEGAEINKSLLALKECIRAMDDNATHVPFRASKLTLVLRDSFISKTNKGRIVMIACVSPGSSSADHTLNTLKYADRLKDRTSAANQKQMPKVDSDYMKEEVQKLKVDPVKKEEKQTEDMPIVRPLMEKKQSLQQPNLNIKNEDLKQAPAKKHSMPNARNVKPVVKDPYEMKIEQIPEKNNAMDMSESSEDERIMEDSPKVKEVKDDVMCMKETMNLDKNKISNEFFDFHEKVNKILEDQEEIFSIHMASIKEDAKLLTEESELISNVQGVGLLDYDIDEYVDKLDHVIRRKLKMYNYLNKKLSKFKLHLKEEEEISSKVKDTFYY